MDVVKPVKLKQAVAGVPIEELVKTLNTELALLLPHIVQIVPLYLLVKVVTNNGDVFGA